MDGGRWAVGGASVPRPPRRNLRAGARESPTTDNRRTDNRPLTVGSALRLGARSVKISCAHMIRSRASIEGLNSAATECPSPSILLPKPPMRPPPVCWRDGFSNPA